MSTTTYVHTLRRAVVAAPRPLIRISAEVRMLLRLLVVASVLVGSTGIYLWASTSVRETGLRLDHARRSLAEARRQHDRLVLEQSMLRDPAHLADAAVTRGLTAPVAVVDLVGAGIP